MSNRPTISLITVCYNAEKTLERTIRSVLAQNYPGLEYIVIDGQSKDGTVELIKRYEAQIATWASERDGGIYDAMNKGVDRATGELVGIVNSDDYLADGALEAIAEAYACDPDADVYHGNIRIFDEEQGQAFEVKPLYSGPQDKFETNPTLHPATFIKREVYEKLGRYDTQYRIAADYDFILRMLEAGVTFHYIDRVLNHMSRGGVSSTQHRRTFHETKLVNVRHGCPPLRANVRFWRSYASATLLERGLKSPLLYRLYKAYKGY